MTHYYIIDYNLIILVEIWLKHCCIKEDIEKGKEEEKLIIAKSLLNLGIAVEVISETTGLSKEQIEQF